MFAVFHTLIFSARKAALAIGEDVHKAYVRSALTLSFLWFLYPIAWGLCDGGNVISTDSEMIFYGILDLLAKPYVVPRLTSLTVQWVHSAPLGRDSLDRLRALGLCVRTRS